MSFREDESRIGNGHSAENFAVVRHFAINPPKQDKQIQFGVRNNRLSAGLDDDYRTNLFIVSISFGAFALEDRQAACLRVQNCR